MVGVIQAQPGSIASLHGFAAAHPGLKGPTHTAAEPHSTLQPSEGRVVYHIKMTKSHIYLAG
jgi:hypothetical protein